MELECIENIENKDTQQNDVPESKTNSLLYECFDVILKVLIAFIIITAFLFKVCTVVGTSMCNTLYQDEKLVISNLFYTPAEGDIIVFHHTGELNEPVVKRVIATGGKWVYINYDTCELYVSDDEIFDDEDIVDESSYVFFDIGKYKHLGPAKIYVPEGYVFVMGDNRNNSLDSRDERIGLIDVKSILGKVIFRVSPADRFGFVK